MFPSFRCFFSTIVLRETEPVGLCQFTEMRCMDAPRDHTWLDAKSSLVKEGMWLVSRTRVADVASVYVVKL